MGRSNTYPTLLIVEALFLTEGYIPEAVKLLGCHRSIIYRRMQKDEHLKKVFDGLYSFYVLSENINLEKLRSDFIVANYSTKKQRKRAYKMEQILRIDGICNDSQEVQNG